MVISVRYARTSGSSKFQKGDEFIIKKKETDSENNKNCFANPIVKVDIKTKKVLICRIREIWAKEGMFTGTEQE
ncbi:hypothetical protein [Desulforamulus putei]|uniref:hypothetical protein n=1 Tax=Desulforamulus putei TaxID=74701 RepID=UPI000934BFED|nr:hypothetical protein [Desulforamulus putei]